MTVTIQPITQSESRKEKSGPLSTVGIVSTPLVFGGHGKQGLTLGWVGFLEGLSLVSVTVDTVGSTVRFLEVQENYRG